MKTQIEIAKAAGVTQQFISQIMLGKARPSWTTAKRLAEVTGTTPILWLEGDPSEIKRSITKEAA